MPCLKIHASSFLTLAIVLAAAGLAANLGTAWPLTLFKGDSAAPTPYTVILRESAVDANGKNELVHRYTFATRADGGSVFMLEGPLGSGAGRATRNIQLPSGVEVKVNDQLKRKSTLRIGVVRRRMPADRCVITGSEEQFGGFEDVAGQRAAKVTRGSRESWYAIDSGCALVRERMAWKEGGVSEKTLVSLTPGEPDARLFEVDAYEEVPPSRLFQAADHRPGEDRRYQKWDEAYYRNRP